MKITAAAKVKMLQLTALAAAVASHGTGRAIGYGKWSGECDKMLHDSSASPLDAAAAQQSSGATLTVITHTSRCQTA